MMQWSGPGAAFGWAWFVGAAVLIIVVLWLLMQASPRAGAVGDAPAILAGRLARGEIDAAEYARMRAVLGAPERGLVRRRLAIVAVIGLVIVVALGLLFGSGPRLPFGSSVVDGAPGPGAPGFVAGTVAAPRVVRIAGTDQLRFAPDVVPIVAGETITFQVTNFGMQVHEFMVGPAADVAADAPGTPEVADIGMMGDKALTYTFNGPGPFAFACHAPGHFEAGMKGTITIQP